MYIPGAESDRELDGDEVAIGVAIVDGAVDAGGVGALISIALDARLASMGIAKRTVGLTMDLCGDDGDVDAEVWTDVATVLAPELPSENVEWSEAEEVELVRECVE